VVEFLMAYKDRVARVEKARPQIQTFFKNVDSADLADLEQYWHGVQAQLGIAEAVQADVYQILGIPAPQAQATPEPAPPALDPRQRAQLADTVRSRVAAIVVPRKNQDTEMSTDELTLRLTAIAQLLASPELQDDAAFAWQKPELQLRQIAGADELVRTVQTAANGLPGLFFEEGTAPKLEELTNVEALVQPWEGRLGSADALRQLQAQRQQFVDAAERGTVDDMRRAYDDLMDADPFGRGVLWRDLPDPNFESDFPPVIDDIARAVAKLEVSDTSDARAAVVEATLASVMGVAPQAIVPEDIWVHPDEAAAMSRAAGLSDSDSGSSPRNALEAALVAVSRRDAIDPDPTADLSKPDPAVATPVVAAATAVPPGQHSGRRKVLVLATVALGAAAATAGLFGLDNEQTAEPPVPGPSPSPSAPLKPSTAPPGQPGEKPGPGNTGQPETSDTPADVREARRLVQLQQSQDDMLVGLARGLAPNDANLTPEKAVTALSMRVARENNWNISIKELAAKLNELRIKPTVDLVEELIGEGSKLDAGAGPVTRRLVANIGLQTPAIAAHHAPVDGSRAKGDPTAAEIEDVLYTGAWAANNQAKRDPGMKGSAKELGKLADNVAGIDGEWTPAQQDEVFADAMEITEKVEQPEFEKMGLDISL
jgi:hypothetical protein